jgi:uncharacterized protein YgiM (DUF1202 family)
MKKIFLFILILTAAASVFALDKGKSAWVTADGDVKKTTGAFAEKNGTVSYGDEVDVLDLNDKWAQVKTPSGAVGWMAQANLSSKRIVARGNNRSASADELALAGKGFTEEIEQQYQTENNLNFDDINAMEDQSIDDEKLLTFIRQGKLNEGQ